MDEIINILKNRLGFIAALDQSGGSSTKTLENYGISSEMYKTIDEEFDLIHEMRKRIIESKSFNNKKILAVILFYETMNRKIEDKYTSLYLLEKDIFSFLKIDEGLEERKNGVSLMKKISNLEDKLKLATKRKIIGTKMRSVIYEANTIGIKEVVNQQFILAEKIYNYGLIPIIEPEVDIYSKDKNICEKILKEEIIKKLNNTNIKVIFKLSIPSIDNLYKDIIDHPNTIRVVALSGGYSRERACELLSHNNRMIASFSRALLENLNVNDSEEEFDKKLENSINLIYNSSVKK